MTGKSSDSSTHSPKGSGDATCSYCDPYNIACTSPAIKDYKYCIEHLMLITRINVRQTMHDIVVELLQVPPQDISDKASFFTDLGADSLDVVEIATGAEDAFHISIPDAEMESLETFGEAYHYVCDKLISQNIFLINQNVDVSANLSKVHNQASTIDKRVDAILNSALFVDYHNRLSLSIEQTHYLLTQTLSCEWIEHVTTIPSLIKNGVLDKVFAIFLTRNHLIYLSLNTMNIFAECVKLSEIFLQPQFFFDAKGNIKRIEVKVLLTPGKRLENSESAHFLFKERNGINGALKFLKKYFAFSRRRQS